MEAFGVIGFGFAIVTYILFMTIVVGIMQPQQDKMEREICQLQHPHASSLVIDGCLSRQ